MLKAREALASTWASNGSEDVAAALAWLEDDRRKSGAKKAAKVADREAKEGVVGVCILSDGLSSQPDPLDNSASTASEASPQAGLIELNCETDFVARNEVFAELVRDLSHTAALFPTLAGDSATESIPRLVDIPVEAFLQFPVMPSSPESAQGTMPRTVQAAIVDAVSRLGEKIDLARVSAISAPLGTAPSGASPAVVASAFTHGAGSSSSSTVPRPGYLLSSGRVASLLLTRFRGVAPPSEDLAASIRGLTRSLARQATGMDTKTIRPSNDAESEVDDALYSQQFMMLLPTAGLSASPENTEETVSAALDRWAKEKLKDAHQTGSDKVEVVDMKRWKLGESAV